MFKKLLLSLLVVVTAFLTGCATPASQNAMSMGIGDIPAKLNPELKGNVNIRNVSGGQDTNPLWISKVDNQGFKSALEQSLIAIGYMAPRGSTAKYQLDATLQDLDQPAFGLTFDVKSTVTYIIIGESGQKVFPVTAIGSASTSDAFIGMERMRIANERSIKENIKLFITNISEQFKR
jgi:hypothetical protein